MSRPTGTLQEQQVNVSTHTGSDTQLYTLTTPRCHVSRPAGTLQVPASQCVHFQYTLEVNEHKKMFIYAVILP